MKNTKAKPTSASGALAAALVSTIFLGLLSACNYNDLKNAPAPAGKTGGLNPDLVVDYATVKTKVLDAACVRCHSGATPRGGVRLETYQQVFEIRDSLRTQVDTGAMPPRPPGLSPEQKALVLAWVDSGAPETTVVTPPSPPPSPPSPPVEPPLPPVEPPTPSNPTDVPTFAEVSAKVFVPHCVKCHSHEVAKGKVNLEDFTSARDFSSEISFVLDTDDMPRKAPALPPELKAIVYAWINGGTPEI